MKGSLLREWDGRVMAGGCLYDDTPEALLTAAAEWRQCAKYTVKDAQQDTDPTYRKIGAMAVLRRRAIARQLAERAAELRA